jgi:hypothetical protein
METSLERMYNTTINISKDYPEEAHAAAPSSRLSFLGEMKFTKVALGFRVRKIQGNFSDLEDIISSNLLYSNLTADDSRLKTTFNFGFGISKGFSFSGYYAQSKIEADEIDPINTSCGIKYPAETTTKAIGVNLSYIY